jgi:L-rhamnose-H+ transport protein
MSLGNSVIFGLGAAFGTLVPAIYYNFVHTPNKASNPQMISHPGCKLVFVAVVG